jgi:hypothetical protein
VSLHLRELARRALHDRRPDPGGVDVEIERVVIDVRMGDRVEMVTVSVREERLIVLATDGTGASSPAARAALGWLAAELPRTSLLPEQRDPSGKVSLAPHAAPLDAAIADLATAIVRSGTDAAETPAIVDALARIGAASTSLEVARWVGRLRAALASRDEVLVARLLAGAHEIESHADPERLVDHVLVELGRELLDGLVPFAIERRHLIDPASGEVLAEERLRDQPASNGPCPRVIAAGLATRTASGRCRVVQYAVSALDADMLARIEALAAPTLAEAFARAEAHGLRSAGREAVSLLRLGAPENGVVRDGAGAPVPLARHEDAAAITATLDALGKGKPDWLLGRWSLARDEASLVPLSCCVEGRIIRLR